MILIRLKEKYDGVTITRSVLGLGEVTFSPAVKEEFYVNYLKLGFDLFECYDSETNEWLIDLEKIKKMKLDKF